MNKKFLAQALKEKDYILDQINFDSSINIFSEEYKECISGDNPKYLRSMPNECSPKNFIGFLKSICEKNYTPTLNSSKKEIPKIIHQIWFGENFPNDYKILQKGWIKKHPNWKYVLWNEKSLFSTFKNGLFNQKLFDIAKKNKNFAKMADIARYEILYKFGGLYVDCDCKCIKSFDVLNSNYYFYAGLEHLINGLVIGNAIIGAQAKHPILKQCLINIKEYNHKKIDLKYWKGCSKFTSKFEREYASTLVTTGPILLTKSVWQILKTFDQDKDKKFERNIIFPPTFFYPWAENKIFPIKPETFSCHFFKGLWKKNMKLKKNKNEQFTTQT